MLWGTLINKHDFLYNQKVYKLLNDKINFLVNLKNPNELIEITDNWYFNIWNNIWNSIYVEMLFYDILLCFDYKLVTILLRSNFLSNFKLTLHWVKMK